MQGLQKELTQKIGETQLWDGGQLAMAWTYEAEAIAREQLVKTRQAGKGLTGAVVICELWRLVLVL
jgi:hypothetical protein